MILHTILVWFWKRIEKLVQLVSRRVFSGPDGCETLEEEFAAEGVVGMEREKIYVLSSRYLSSKQIRCEAESLCVNEQLAGVGNLYRSSFFLRHRL